VKRIERRGRSSGDLFVAAMLRGRVGAEEGCEGLGSSGSPFIGWRGSGEDGRGGAGRSVASAAINGARCGRRPLRGGEEGRAAVGECGALMAKADGRGAGRRRRGRETREAAPGTGDQRPARGRKGARPGEEEDGPDVWAPHVSGQREREGGEGGGR
jgi:hypothetical protein